MTSSKFQIFHPGQLCNGSVRPNLQYTRSFAKSKQWAESKQTSDHTKINNFHTGPLYITSVKLYLQVLKNSKQWAESKQTADLTKIYRVSQ